MEWKGKTIAGLVNSSVSLMVFVSALPLLGLDDSKELGRYGRQSWQTESGLPQNTVRTILQTHDGYLWFGTEGGLVRFDGLKFLIFDSQNTSTLRSNDIRSLVEDANHSLWVATADGLTRFSGLTASTFTTNEGLPSNNLWSVFADRAGSVSAITPEGLARYENGRFRSYDTPEGLSINAVATKDPFGVWIGTQSGLRLLRNGRFEKVSSRTPLPSGSVQVLLSDRSGRLWIGTPNGLSVYQNGSVKTYMAKQGLPSNRVISLYEDREGSIWVGTDAGLARITNDTITRLPANDPLSGSLVLSMFEDREGSLWLGTESGGVTVLRDEKFATYTSRDGLSQDLVRCLFSDRNDVLWIGTEGGLDRWNGSRFSAFTTKDGLASNVILALAESADGALLVGTPDGLNIVRNGRILTLTSADGLSDDFVRSIYRDKDDSVWIGSRRGICHWTRGQFRTYTQQDGLGSDFVGAVLRDSRHDLWIGTLGGLTCLHNGRFVNYTTANGLSSNIITALYDDANGVLWIGTQDGGLNRYEGGKFLSYPARLGVPNVIYGILEDADQNLWLSSKSGIFRINKKDLNAFASGHTEHVALVSYGTGDGLAVSECSGGGHPAVDRMQDGSLWFSTLKGVATITSKEASASRLAPPVAVESISIDDETFNSAQARDVSPGRSRFSFEYAGLSFLSPYTIQFRYKLDGFDKDWIDAGTRRVAYYTNIPPGRYVFRVLARNRDSAWSADAVTYAFRLEPHFYQTYWFYFLLFVLLAFLTYEVYRWRVRQVQARFDAVLAERNRIAREIHDTLAQGFVAVAVQLELLGRILSSSNGSAQALVKQIRASVQNSLAEARSSIWKLRSQAATDQDLATKLSTMVSNTTSISSAEVTFRVLGTYRPVSPDVANELLSIGQEAVTNAVRHANAQHINVDLAFEAKKFRLIIADDGCGFIGSVPSSGPNGHFGLQGMRERAEQIAATLSVTSVPGKGTRVCVERTID